MNFKRSKYAFTIIELVIVIAVIGILAAVLIPTFSNVIKNTYETLAYNEAKETLQEFSLQATKEGKKVTDGTVFKVFDENDSYYYVYYNGDLLEFYLDSTDDALDVKDTLTTTMVRVGSEYYYCDRYFILKDEKGELLKDENGDTLYFYYSYQATINEELKNNEGTPITFKGSSAKCKIYVGLVSTTPPVSKIQNIIYMIPDGAGFGSYDLANTVKLASPYYSGIQGAATKTTTNAISGLTSNGLYLDNFMIASSNTLLNTSHNGSYITDSAAAGTALSSGYRTEYCSAGVDSNNRPHANLLELAQLAGKSTGVVTTKSWIDATPEAFLAHVDHRYQQEFASLQALYSNVDVLLAYGTESGVDITGDLVYKKHNQKASNLGYVVVNDSVELNREVYNNCTKKIWSNFTEGKDNRSPGDISSNHISYDTSCDSSTGEAQLTLLEMTKAALHILSKNINNPNGFFLMIEGGAIDNAAEGRYALQTTGEYLAFDEAFAYCVNFAKGRRDTIVVASPDHDSGGFYSPEHMESDGRDLENKITDDLVESIWKKSLDKSYQIAGKVTGHSDQNVPVWFYGPDNVRNIFLSYLNIPFDTSKDKVRILDVENKNGYYYDGSKFNPDYTIMNYELAPAIAKLCCLISFEEATDRLFVDATSFGKYSIKTTDGVEERIFELSNGEIVYLNTNYYIYNKNNDKKYKFSEGRAILVGAYTDKISDPTFTSNFKVWLPREFLISRGYIS